MAITLENALNSAAKLLKDSGIEDASLNAEVLLAHVLHLRRTELYLNPDRELGDEDISSLTALVQSRINRTPLQYITGHTEFMSLDFTVNRSVLIPRPETEFVVESVISKAGLFGAQQTLNILDIGTGCGNIAVSLAVNLKNARIYACDISKDALEVARANAQKHNVSKMITFAHGDLFEAFNNSDLRGEVNFIVSNPPYIADAERTMLQPEIADHEPDVALFSGKDGLIFYRRILSEAADWLAPGGCVVMELGEGQADSIATLIGEQTGLNSFEFVKDLQKIDRVLVANKK